MFDITLIENIHKILSDLETEGFVCSDINLKVISKLRNKVYFKKYTSLAELYNQNKTMLSDQNPNRYCKVGDFCFIDSIKFSNKVSNYLSDFYFWGITSKQPVIKDKTNYDNNRNEFYLSDKLKYKEYLKTTLLLHLDRNIVLANIRLNSYVDVCYVDVNYVEEVPEFENSIISSF